MLQTVLAGAQSDELELEPVFLEHGPWARELESSGYRVHVLAAGRLREVVPMARVGRRVATRSMPRRAGMSCCHQTTRDAIPASVAAGAP